MPCLRRAWTQALSRSHRAARVPLQQCRSEHRLHIVTCSQYVCLLDRQHLVLMCMRLLIVSDGGAYAGRKHGTGQVWSCCRSAGRCQQTTPCFPADRLCRQLICPCQRGVYPFALRRSLIFLHACYRKLLHHADVSSCHACKNCFLQHQRLPLLQKPTLKENSAAAAHPDSSRTPTHQAPAPALKKRGLASTVLLLCWSTFASACTYELVDV